MDGARDFWKRFSRNKGAVVGLFILVLVLATAAASARSCSRPARGR